MTRRRKRRPRKRAGQSTAEDLLQMDGVAQCGQLPGPRTGNAAQAQLEAMLGGTSQAQQALHGGYGGATWGTGGLGAGGLGANRLSPSLQASNPMQSSQPGMSAYGSRGTPANMQRGTSGSSLPGAFGGSFGGGGSSGHLNSSIPSMVGSSSVSPSSAAGLAGVCLDFLSGRCPRGPACSLSHALLPPAPQQLQQQPMPQPQSYLVQQVQQQQQRLHRQQLQQQQLATQQAHQQSQQHAAAFSQQQAHAQAQQQQQQQQQQQHHHQHQQEQASQLQQQQQPQPAQQFSEPAESLLLRYGLDVQRGATELSRQDLGAVVVAQARMFQEQAAAIAALEKQVGELQRYLTSALLTFEQRHWAALLGNEQRIGNKVEQSVRAVVAAVEDKLDAMTAAAEGGGAHRALSSKASTAHWPKAAELQAQVQPPPQGLENLGTAGVTSNDTFQARHLTEALDRIQLGSGQVKMPPRAASAQESGGFGSAEHPEASREQAEVEALLREISASSAGGSGSPGPEKGPHTPADSLSSGSGHRTALAPMGAPEHASEAPSRLRSGADDRQAGRAKGQSPEQGGGERAAAAAAWNGGGDRDGGATRPKPAHRTAGQDDQHSVVGSCEGDHGRRSSSGRNVPDEVVKEVKEIQDEETGELLRVFEEHQNSSSNSGGSGNAEKRRASHTESRNSSLQAADSGCGSVSSEANSGDVRAKLQAAQERQAQSAQEGDSREGSS